MTTNDALLTMLAAVRDKAAAMVLEGYSDSDYDVMENYLTITQALLAADYEGDLSLLPTPEEAPWCPKPVVEFLRRVAVQ